MRSEMCGICGIVYKDEARRCEKAVLKHMCDTLIHRGPDDEGQIVRRNAGLGMRRLAIIDLETGRQPLSSEDNRFWIVFNGEIYNFGEIRKQLLSMGYQFKTKSDTESILHGYEMWQEGVCGRLNGMFGFAIWDEKARRLFLARDRLGIKPLYYYEDGEKIVFGSEIKAILACPDVRVNLDPIALNHYLTVEYVPAPRSIFDSIHKLKPGHWLTLKEGKSRIEPYWILEPREESISMEDASDRLSELVRDSVRRRLISDVPLGAFLSGGIDSSILVSQMAGLVDRPVKTFSIGFKESSYNELVYARAVAKRYETEHHEFMIEPNAVDLTETLIKHLDEPFGDFSIFPTYLVSKMARSVVTVALSGDGGDELFAGYDTYRANRFEKRFYRLLPAFFRKHVLGSIGSRLVPTEKKKGWINSFKRFVQGAEMDSSLAHVRWMVFMNDAQRRALFTRNVQESLSGTDPFDFIRRVDSGNSALDDITRMGFIDVNTYLVDDILVKVDRMSMAASLEARVPYLDHRLVEFAYSLPPSLKMRGFNTKRILKQTFWDALPVEVQRRDKQGFSIPIKNWIREALRPMMLDLLSEQRIRRQGLFNAEFVTRLIDEHLQGSHNHSHLLWALMVFEQWFDLYAS